MQDSSARPSKLHLDGLGRNDTFNCHFDHRYPEDWVCTVRIKLDSDKTRLSRTCTKKSGAIAGPYEIQTMFPAFLD